MQGSGEDNSDEASTLWVGGVSGEVDEELLYELFLNAGPIRSVTIPFDRVTNRQKAYAFVRFEYEDSVPYAAELFRDVRLFGQPLKLQNRSTGVGVGGHAGGGGHHRQVAPGLQERQQYQQQQRQHLNPEVLQAAFATNRIAVQAGSQAALTPPPPFLPWSNQFNHSPQPDLGPHFLQQQLQLFQQHQHFMLQQQQFQQQQQQQQQQQLFVGSRSQQFVDDHQRHQHGRNRRDRSRSRDGGGSYDRSYDQRRDDRDRGRVRDRDLDRHHRYRSDDRLDHSNRPSHDRSRRHY